MHFAPNVFDVWAFQRRAEGVVFLLLHTSVEKAARYFNGGRFWQIPSDSVNDGESVVDAVGRVLHRHGLRPRSIWAGEHAYLIYNRRFAEMQAIAVYAVGGLKLLAERQRALPAARLLLEQLRP